MNLWLPGGGDSQGRWEGHVNIASFKMDTHQRQIVQHMELLLVLCASPGGKAENGCMYMYG